MMLTFGPILFTMICCISYNEIRSIQRDIKSQISFKQNFFSLLMSFIVLMTITSMVFASIN